MTAVLVFPHLGYAPDPDQYRFGLLAGTAVNDTHSVVAVATSSRREAADSPVVKPTAPS